MINWQSSSLPLFSLIRLLNDVNWVDALFILSFFVDKLLPKHFQRVQKRYTHRVILSFALFGGSEIMSFSNPLQCENCLKNETAKFQELYQKFSKEKVTHLQALKGILPHSFQFSQKCGWKAWIITCSITSHIFWSISLSNCSRFVACNNICYTSYEHDNIRSN